MPRFVSSLLGTVVSGITLCQAVPSVQVFTDLISPQPVGTVIGISAKGKDEGDPKKVGGKLRYQLSVSDDGTTFHVVRDFTRFPGFAWSPTLYEHEAKIKVTVLNTETKQTGETVVPFRVTPRISGNKPLASPTAHPLVALFSFPACSDGSKYLVAFQRKGETTVHRTGSNSCRTSTTNNFYVAGMRPDSEYTLHSEITNPSGVQKGPEVPFRTGLVDVTFGRFNVIVPRNDDASKSEPVILFSSPGRPLASMATDTEGNVLWYMRGGRNVTRILPGGTFLAFNERVTSIAEVDLVGNALRETDINRLQEQLEAFGIKSVCKPNGQQCASGFHHEAIGLPNGHIIAVGSVERVFPSGAQGSDDPVNIAGTILYDLDENMQLKWVWNAFDHLDVKRKSLEDNAQCRGQNGGLACAPVFLTPAANDWLHGNAVSYTRQDGNLTLSMPEQDWVIKIDYNNGKGSGKIVWKLGKDGDLTLKSEDPKAWFSYQHDAGFEPPGSDMLVLLDNGHRRKPKEADKPKDSDKEKDKPAEKKDDGVHSRGQVWKIDEQAKTATLVTNADLGVYAPFMGSAQRLSNGNYHFSVTVQDDDAPKLQAIEVTPAGKIAYVLESPQAGTYRSNRVADLYTPPNR